MKKRIFLALILIIVLTLSGCASVSKLTEAEADIISQYATQTLVKHSNKNNSLLLSREKLAEKEAAEKEKADEAEKKKSEEAKKENDKKEDNKNENKPSNNSGDAVESSLSEALGIEGLNASYINYKVLDSYSTDYVLIQPTTGNNLLVLNFALSNKTDKKLTCDIDGSCSEFEVMINDSGVYQNMLTILLSDLSTLKTEIEPGATRNVVLVFNIPKDGLSSITSMDLLVSHGADNKTLKVKL